MTEPGSRSMKHLDEMTCLLYVERQLERERAQEVSSHTQSCAECRTLLRALERESRLLTRAMIEEEEPLPAKLAQFHERAKRSMQWIWGVVFSLAATGVYALYTGYIEPWQQQLEQAGFGGTNLLGLLVFQGAFWKGWQSMFTLLEVFALVSVAGFGAVIFRKRLRRRSALAMVFVSLGMLLALAAPASATEFRKGESVEVAKDETIKGDLFVSCGRARIDGTVDGDLFFFGQSLDVNGHVTGDVIVFAQIARINGQVDGNIRSFTNTVTVNGNVAKNALSFAETISLDSAGKIGGSATTFSESLGVDGKIGRDVLSYFQRANISGTVAGGVQARGESLVIGSSAQIDGPVRFEGANSPNVSSQAKLASPVEFKKYEHRAERERGAGTYIWWVIWTAAILLFGLVLASLMPQFAQESLASAERYGAAFGLGVLVFFGVLIAALLACVTIVGLPVGLAGLLLWCVVVFSAQIVVGTVVGQWILGPRSDLWALFLRMALGLVIVRIAVMLVGRVHGLGFLFHLAIWIWGMGAVSLALYRRFQPMMAPSGPAGPPVGTPLPPNTTVGGVQPT